MGTINKSDDEYSYIGDKGDIGFIDLDASKALCTYNPSEESDIVRISVPFPFVNDKPRSGFVGEVIYDSVTIENLTEGALDLWSVDFYDSKPENTFTISLMEPPNANSDEQYIRRFVEAAALEDRMLRTDKPLVLWLSCKPKDIGLHTAAVHFTVGDETIERLLFVLAEDKISQSLSSKRPYSRQKKKNLKILDVHTEDVKFVAGRRPNSNRSSSYRLPDYPIPKDIRDMVNNRQTPDVINDGLSEINHALFFKTLLAMEEIKLEENMAAYDMECVTMTGRRRDQYMSLEVPGLAERRPSLVNGDFIFVKLASGHGTTDVAYQGYIHRVEAEEVHLMFDEDFHCSHHESNLYNVQFSFNRVSMRRLYQAVEASEGLESMFLFPSFGESKLVQPAPLVPISCTLNKEQMSAVEMILSCKGESPYVIHGPPGTGKTVTLIEAILQVYTKSRKSRILVCAPSNSAADHILERLVVDRSANNKTREIFRLNAYTRPFEDVNPDHIKFCCLEELMFKCPSRWDLQKYRIIISTYTSASLLYSEGIKTGHFSHIFLDEAGQASEPETMVPLSQLHSRGTVVILAGDPMQLGPVLFSKDAESFGLGKSYLQRLLEFEPYSSGNQNFMTKLVRNYRTHPDILHLPSELFYDGELIPSKEVDSDFLTSLEDLLPNKEFPVLFVGIQGCDEREGNNPSWFNRIEASKVVEIIKLLTEQKGLEEEDVGVITPYRQQVLKIRTALEDLGQPRVKVGSVEQFQGQEKQVIIISTVRSTVKHNEFDRLHYLGFLSNPKRFNVAITRARSLLIIIGNPHILCKDPYWNQLLWYCVDNNSYKGCFLPERVELLIGADSSQPLNSEWVENGDKSNPTGAEWGGNDQWGEEQNTWDHSNGQWGEEQNNWDPSNDQWGQPQNNPEHLNDQWEANSWESSKDQSSNRGNNWEPSNSQWGNERNSWEPSSGQWGEEKNNSAPSKDQWGEKQNRWEPSGDNWGEEKNQWGNEGNSWEPSTGQWGEEKNYFAPKDQWGEKQKPWEPSGDYWAEEKNQWGSEGNSWEPSSGQWGDRKNNLAPSKDQWGEKQNCREPSGDDWGEEKNNWDPSKEQRGQKPDNRASYNGGGGEEKSNWDPSKYQCGKKQNRREPSKDQWGKKQNNWEVSKDQRGKKQNSWEASKDQWCEVRKNEPSKDQCGEEQKDQEPLKNEWRENGSKPSNHQQVDEGQIGWKSNGNCGDDEGKTRKPCYGERGSAESSSKSSEHQWPKRGDNGNTSSEDMTGVEEISNRLSNLESSSKVKKVAPTGWE